MITRQHALEILNKNIKNRNLIKHCLAVEAAMKGLANHFKQDENKWGLIGLVHDSDWEVTKDAPNLHTTKTLEWLKAADENNPEILQAIISHNYVHTGQNPPNSMMEWSLYCCDDLTGLIVASTLVLPDKKLSSLTVKSVLKKFPAKKFAANVNREQIKICEEKLGLKLEEFVLIVLQSMQKIAPDLGL